MDANKLPNIYLVGYAGAGKTFGANWLKEKYNYQTAKFAFPVYNLAYNYFDMHGKNRELLQIIGTECGRDLIDQNIWVKRFKEDMQIVKAARQRLGYPNFPYIIDDCRFYNEHQALKDMGWVGIYLEVPGDIRIKRLMSRDGTAQEKTLNHASETAIDQFKDGLIKVDASGDLASQYFHLNALIQSFGE